MKCNDVRNQHFVVALPPPPPTRMDTIWLLFRDARILIKFCGYGCVAWDDLHRGEIRSILIGGQAHSDLCVHTLSWASTRDSGTVT